MRVCALVLTLSLAGVFSASAQSLADVARKENDRRQGVKEPGGKTWTNQDLKPVPAAPTEETPAAAPDPAVSEPPADAPKADDETAAGAKKAEAGEEKAEEVKDQKYWSSRMAELRARLERDETFRDALQSRVDALTADFVNRDDPAQRSQIALDREKALSELDRVKKSIEQGRRAIPELEEEARREGVPAGWLR